MMRLVNHSPAYDETREVLALLPVEPCHVPVWLISRDLKIKCHAVSDALANIREAGFSLSFGGSDGNSVSLARDSVETAQIVASRYIEQLYE